jgi:hypothetical protein
MKFSIFFDSPSLAQRTYSIFLSFSGSNFSPMERVRVLKEIDGDTALVERFFNLRRSPVLSIRPKHLDGPHQKLATRSNCKNDGVDASLELVVSFI